MSIVLDKATRILSKVYGGDHHIPGKIKDKGHFVECNIWKTLSTYDNTELTRLVIAAHDECCRIAIQPGGPGYLKLLFSNRKRPEGCGEDPIMDGHVTIEEAIEVYRERGRYDQYLKKPGRGSEQKAQTNGPL